jgi:glycine/D-amino acid oxidase-like deaminating enzyme
MKAAAVICGAGIAGVATAFQLVVEKGWADVVLVDPRPPLTLTSDKSAECFRNWWPNAPMVGLMNRSIDLLEDFARRSNNSFHLAQQGYLYVTAEPARLRQMEADAELITNLGGGPYDLHSDGDELRSRFPFLTDSAIGGVHALRAGWFSAQQLGSWMLREAQARGLQLLKGEMTSVDESDGRVGSVTVDGERIETPIVVNAAGPMVKRVAAMVGVDLPVFSEVHIKIAFRDHLGVIPRSSPMVIWADPQVIDWSAEERDGLEELGRHDLLGTMPAACHYRPEGGEGSQWLVGLWEYHRLIQEPSWPLPDDPLYPEAVLRGLTTMVPGFAPYLDHLPQPLVDGGYYTKTRENRPLVTRLGPEGSFLVGAFSGFGVMASAAAGELMASMICEAELPAYATAFSFDRYEDPEYLREIDSITDTGQI